MYGQTLSNHNKGTHVRVRANTHAHTLHTQNAQTHTQTHTNTYAHKTHMSTHKTAHTNTNTLTHMQAHAHTFIHTCTYTHIYICTWRASETRTCKHTVPFGDGEMQCMHASANVRKCCNILNAFGCEGAAQKVCVYERVLAILKQSS